MVLPVHNASVVQEEESQDYLCSIKPCPVLIELSRPLYLKHEVTSIDVLHHKVQPILKVKIMKNFRKGNYHIKCTDDR